MNALGRPAVIAALALAAAALVSPHLDLGSRLPAGDGLTMAEAFLLVAGLASTRGGPAARLLAIGALAATLGLAYDAVRGEHGRIVAPPGTATRTFEEIGRGARVVGRRPLGFDLAVEDGPGDALRLVTADGEATVTPGRAARLGGYGFGMAGRSAPLVLVLGIAGPGGRESQVRLEAGASVKDGELDITLERYFPDFALDERQQPFSRSEAHDNPAALLDVRRGAAAWRVFVLRAAPGLHRPEGLDRVLRLVDVQAGTAVELTVTREPGAPVAAAGLLVAAAALVVARRRA